MILLNKVCNIHVSLKSILSIITKINVFFLMVLVINYFVFVLNELQNPALRDRSLITGKGCYITRGGGRSEVLPLHEALVGNYHNRNPL